MGKREKIVLAAAGIALVVMLLATGALIGIAVAGGPKDTSVYGQGPYVIFVGTIKGLSPRNKEISGPIQVTFERRVLSTANRIAEEPEERW